MTDELEHELAIFDRPVGLHVGDDWTVSFPESWVTEISQNVAEWLLAQHSGEDVPPEVASFLSHLRGDLSNAQAQGSMLP